MYNTDIIFAWDLDPSNRASVLCWHFMSLFVVVLINWANVEGFKFMSYLYFGAEMHGISTFMNTITCHKCDGIAKLLLAFNFLVPMSLKQLLFDEQVQFLIDFSLHLNPQFSLLMAIMPRIYYFCIHILL